MAENPEEKNPAEGDDDNQNQNHHDFGLGDVRDRLYWPPYVAAWSSGISWVALHLIKNRMLERYRSLADVKVMSRSEARTSSFEGQVAISGYPKFYPPLGSSDCSSLGEVASLLLDHIRAGDWYAFGHSALYETGRLIGTTFFTLVNPRTWFPDTCNRNSTVVGDYGLGYSESGVVELCGPLGNPVLEVPDASTIKVYGSESAASTLRFLTSLKGDRKCTIIGKLEQCEGSTLLLPASDDGRGHKQLPVVISHLSHRDTVHAEYRKSWLIRWASVGAAVVCVGCVAYILYYDWREWQKSKSWYRSVQKGRRRKRNSIEPDTNHRTLCVVCLSKPREIAFLPCGHYMACRVCSRKLKFCPMCRRPFKERQRIYAV
mmetsp:Transcript_19532/g.34841  ORF Transcript_19532/g.34841 Transcript_19532/m.34841 type:complete len:374 (-) Transcript_19532:204-1325(-)|eukprot:CAMPEP_0197531788 /NCGR_PEP_ID=MMETSP1318-20131121/37124_1 /TAXON_ID=552666 /ORGANISM="Partenskyella glossopodia, Strain RCC365" /LENGTH=373 /DNA_ID=CAMNT_0043088129 /DNA_START=189 /DNA_END=1310 /DNA_ORIENTATION=+